MSTHASPRAVVLALLILSLRAHGSVAAPPSPLEMDSFAFPGAVDHPVSAASAGMALADRWLGDDPCTIPAAPYDSRVSLSPALVRVTRQDLRADNRNYDETPAFFDAAGGSAGFALPPRLGPIATPGRLALWLYGSQPVLRREDNAFTRGRAAFDPGKPPAVIESRSTAREARLGAALSGGTEAWRIGGGIEYTRRDDVYEAVERSGSPTSGLRHVDFEGDCLTFQLGARWDPAERLTVGAAARYFPTMTVEGVQRLELLTGDSTAPIAANRESAWEGGVSARWFASEGFGLLASVGGRTEQAWEGFDVTAGVVFRAAAGMDYRVPDAPWSLRFGVGHEQQSDVPEPRATSVAVGAGWDLSGTVIDFGAVRRSFHRGDGPTSYDDRVIATVRVDF